MISHRLKKSGFRLWSKLPGTALSGVSAPRAGSPIKSRLAMVFGRGYQIQSSCFNRHPFDTLRYSRIYTALCRNLNLSPQSFYVPTAISWEDIALVHSDHFISGLNHPATLANYLEWPLLAELPGSAMAEVTDPFRYATGGTLLAARQAMLWGIGINIGGGFHHAKPRYGEGFCLFADIPITIRRLKAENKLGKSMVVDLDVHQGNGTVVCIEEEDQCFTFSMHQEHIYPSPKEESDLDIELEAGTGDKTYLALLTHHLPKILDGFKPELVFYVAGCDPLMGDPLASLSLTPDGIAERDRYVIASCKKREIPVVMTLAGGYRHDAWKVQADSITKLVEAFT